MTRPFCQILALRLACFLTKGMLPFISLFLYYLRIQLTLLSNQKKEAFLQLSGTSMSWWYFLLLGSLFRSRLVVMFSFPVSVICSQGLYM